MRVDLFVLNYNGASYISECLSSLIAATKNSKHDCRLYVIDNESTDESLKIISEQFPDLEVWKMKNRVLCSFNDATQRSNTEVVIFLNYDLKVDSGFIDPLIAPFQSNPQVFMVTPKDLSFEGKYQGGRARFRIKYGIFWASCKFQGYDALIDQPGHTMSAGYGAFHREKFLALGGYDDLYLPGRLEDTDICFRAWKKGWVSLYEPQSIAYHKGGVAFHKAFGVKGTLIINHRNAFLFFWKNISDSSYLAQHFFFLPFRLLFALLRGQFEFILGFFRALPRLREALQKRAKVPAVLRDREILQLV